MAVLASVKKRRIIKSDDFESSNFTIVADSKAFKALSDSIYSKKVMAVLRELSTNALDAHIYAGHTEPFEVHLPTTFENKFYIRDFGPGLSEDEIRQLYTCYFKSGDYKIVSNDYVGCFGLGSKSPFAYTSTFCIISYHGGYKTTYCAYIGEDGIPKIDKIDCVVSNERSGLHIEIATKHEDRRSFQEEAQSLYKYFKIKPKLVGALLDTSNITYNTTGKIWGIRNDNGGNKFTSQARAVIGNIVYPILSDKLTSRDGHVALCDLPIDIHCQVGDLDVTLSREHLEYNKKTIFALHKYFDIILADFGKLIENEICNCKSTWQARCSYFNITNDYNNSYFRIAKLCHIPIMYNGVKINDAFINVEYFSDLKLFTLGKSRYDYDKHTYVYSVKRFDDVKSIRPKTKLLLFRDDLSVGSISRINTLLKNCDSKKYDSVLLFTGDYDEFNKVCSILGTSKDDWALTSSLPQPIIIKKKRGECKAKVLQLKISRRYDYQPNYTAWDSDVEIDVNNPGLYVIISRHRIVDINIWGNPNPNILANKLYILRLLELEVPPVFGVKKQYVKQFQKRKWVDANIWYEEKLQEWVDNIDAKQCLANREHLNHFQHNNIFQNLNVNDFNECSLFKRFILKYNDMVKSAGKLNNLKMPDILCIISSDGFSPTHHLDTLHNQILHQYPMLSYLEKNFAYGKINDKALLDLADYVKMTDLNLTSGGVAV